MPKLTTIVCITVVASALATAAAIWPVWPASVVQGIIEWINSARLTAIASFIAALGAFLAVWLAFPRRPNIIFETPELADNDPRRCVIEGEEIKHNTWQVHFTFKNNYRFTAITPQISLQVPVDYIPMEGVPFSAVDNFNRERDESYYPVPMQGKYCPPRVAMVDVCTKDMHQEISSDKFEELKSSRLPGRRRRYFLEKMPFMEPGLSYTFWIRLAIPEIKEKNKPVILSVSTPKFQKHASRKHKYFLHEKLPQKKC